MSGKGIFGIIRNFCISEKSCDNCILKGFFVCKLHQRPFEWPLEKIQHKFQDADFDALKRIRATCKEKSRNKCKGCGYLMDMNSLNNSCYFYKNEPRQWTRQGLENGL